MPDLARIWAALLYAGPGAAASHGTALWLAGAIDQCPLVVEIAVPQPRQVVAQPGLRVRRAQDLGARVHPAREPPRTRIEVAVLDHADACAGAEAVVDVVLRPIQRRQTTAARLRTELTGRARHRWRRLIAEVLTEAEDGVATPLERRYARDVERAHGLPRGLRNRPGPRLPDQGNRYRDVRYQRWGTVVETDGRGAHPDDEEFRDHRRDNALVAGTGEAVLRYGWRDVAGRPCEVAAQVAAVLRMRGWPGVPLPCGPACALPRTTPQAQQRTS